MDKDSVVFADAGDFGLRFVFYHDLRDLRDLSRGGLRKSPGDGHFVTIVGRGGTAKSMLALQFCRSLLTRPGNKGGNCFYFTLEATKLDLENHLVTIGGPEARKHPLLHIRTLSSPVESLLTLNHTIQQTIAEELSRLPEKESNESPPYPLCTVVDPLGGIKLNSDLRRDLSHLRDLVRRHRMFLILICEDHVFREHSAIEHYSETVIHLEHEAASRPDRSLYVQKCRLQPFWPGRHQVELVQHDGAKDGGVRVYPSMEAVSAFAHELKNRSPSEDGQDQTTSASSASPLGENDKKPPHLKALRELLGTESEQQETEAETKDKKKKKGAVLFLMGPPGTMKGEIAAAFYTPRGEAEGSKIRDTLFMSFKAEIPKNFSDDGFIDARNPLWTPEQILSLLVGRLFAGKGDKEEKNESQFKRAVIWGLRRLSDMPNFDDGKDVLFLEIVVTLLRERRITSLLVDWPDLDRRSALPIVDLCQQILLTRICKRREDIKPEGLGDKVWGSNSPPGEGRRERAVLIRAQRSTSGFHRDWGCLLIREENKPHFESIGIESIDFERYWVDAGYRWEEDPALFDLGERSQ